MPKQTFLNLKPRRRREILEVAYREFTMYDYQNASLSRIIRNLNLAKGSFYRYFSSKKELYFYLLELVTESRYETLDEQLNSGIDFFELIRRNWHDKIRYEKEHPLESGFIYRVMRERYNPEIGNIELELKRTVIERVKSMITGPFSGDIRKDVAIDMIAYAIVQLQLGFYDFLAMRHDDDLLVNLERGEPIYALDHQSIESIIEGFTAILQGGIINSQKHDNG